MVDVVVFIVDGGKVAGMDVLASWVGGGRPFFPFVGGNLEAMPECSSWVKGNSVVPSGRGELHAVAAFWAR